MEQAIDANAVRLKLPLVKAAGRNERSLPHHQPGEMFLKGPIPMKWLEKAGRQAGKALHVAVAIWFWAGIKRSTEIRLSVRKMEALGVARHAGYRALAALEAAGLISVERHQGRQPIVTILDVLDS